MALPFYRGFYQVARVISQPAVKLLKRIHSLNPPLGRYSNFLVGFGRSWYRFQRIISNQKLKVIEISREGALSKGIQNFYSIVFYCTFFMFPVCEIVGIWKEGIRKDQESRKKVSVLDTELVELEELAKKANLTLEKQLVQMLK